MEKMTNELSMIIKTENGSSGKESASKSQTQHQQKTKENTENYHSEQWNDVIQCAIDSDLQCNICFEIFIKVGTHYYTTIIQIIIISNYIISFI